MVQRLVEMKVVMWADLTVAEWDWWMEVQMVDMMEFH